jgi:hypothetical protein
MMTPPPLPSYVNWGGDQTYPQPVNLQGTCFRGFFVEADATALRNVCDKYLNRFVAGDIEYHPLLSRVMLGVADIRRISCLHRPDAEQFWFPEVDVAFWMPVVAGRRRGPVFVAERLVWFLPYVIVNHPWALVCGRELYGFPKELGLAHVAKDFADRLPCTVDTYVVKQFGPEAEAKMDRLLEVSRTDDASSSTLTVVWNDLREAVRDVLHTLVGKQTAVSLPGMGLIVELYDLFVHHEMPMVFLKEFRDVTDGKQACYQDVVEAPIQLTRLHTGGWLPGEYEINIGQYASHPIVSDLGLHGACVKVEAAWYMEFDFVLGNGKKVT